MRWRKAHDRPTLSAHGSPGNPQPGTDGRPGVVWRPSYATSGGWSGVAAASTRYLHSTPGSSSRVERLLNFARVVGRERVMAGADCGFAQGAMHQRQHPTVMWARFEALVQGARLASER